MLLEKLIEFKQREVEIPVAGGRLHVISCVAVVLLSILLSMIVRRANDGVFRLVIFTLWIVMLAGELYKQIIFPMHIVDGEIVYTYEWNLFPFQLCSTPLYVLPFLALMRDTPGRDFAAGYIMTVSLIGGLAVYLVPSTVFRSNEFSNIHTMVHHGIQIITAIVTAAYYRGRAGLKMLLKSETVFVGMFTVAALLNKYLYEYLLNTGKCEDFNMFYINPSLQYEIPVMTEWFSQFYGVPMMILYFIGITLASALLMWLYKSLSFTYKRHSRVSF